MIFYVGRLTNIKTYTASNWDIKTIVNSADDFSISSELSASYPVAINVSANGMKLYVAEYYSDTSLNHIFQYSMSTPWSLPSASYDSVVLDVSSECTLLYDIQFSVDGSKLYALDQTTDKIYQYTLSTPWGISTASYASKYVDTSSESTNLRNFCFNYAGNTLYTKHSTSVFYQYTLSTPWDISTASYASKTATISAAVQNFCISTDGKTITATAFADYINRYDLTTAFDISSIPSAVSDRKGLYNYGGIATSYEPAENINLAIPKQTNFYNNFPILGGV